VAFYDKTVTIANNGTTSAAIDTGLLSTHSKTQLVGITFPASMTSTAMTVQRATTESGTYTVLREVGGASDYPITVTSEKTVPLDPRVFITAPWIKLVCGTAETGAKVITLHFHEVV
jgi:hypothetical protein